MGAAIGADDLEAVEERLGDGWTRNVHYRPPAGTEVETGTYHAGVILSGDGAPFMLEPHHVEWWRDSGDALRVSCVERSYQVAGEGPGGTVRERTDGLDAAERYLQDELGYDHESIDTDAVI